MSISSREHEKFLKRKKKEKKIVIISQIAILMLFIVIWQFLSDLKLINTFLFSSPKNILNTIIDLFNNDLLLHIKITTYETIISFVISSIVGLLFATVMWWNKTLAKILDPYLTVINSLPKVALGPLIIIWVGTSTNSIIVMALMISLIISIINIYNSFMLTEKSYITLLKSFNATKLQIFYKVIIPYNKLNIINTLKINISMSLIGLLPPVGENFIV